MAKYKQKDLVEINSKIEEEAVLSKATVIFANEEYSLKECGSVMSTISRKGETMQVYTSQLKILKKTARRLESQAKARARAQKKQKYIDIKNEKEEAKWIRENLPSLSNYDLL